MEYIVLSVHGNKKEGHFFDQPYFERQRINLSLPVAALLITAAYGSPLTL